jgi:hypothetical protein
MNHPEFNMYAGEAAQRLIGWEGLRTIMEDNIESLRKLTFIDCGKAHAIDEQVGIVGVPTEFGALYLVPLLDTEGYRSIMFLLPADRREVHDGQHRTRSPGHRPR